MTLWDWYIFSNEEGSILPFAERKRTVLLSIFTGTASPATSFHLEELVLQMLTEPWDNFAAPICCLIDEWEWTCPLCFLGGENLKMSILAWVTVDYMGWFGRLNWNHKPVILHLWSHMLILYVLGQVFWWGIGSLLDIVEQKPQRWETVQCLWFFVLFCFVLDYNSKNPIGTMASALFSVSGNLHTWYLTVGHGVWSWWVLKSAPTQAIVAFKMFLVSKNHVWPMVRDCGNWSPKCLEGQSCSLWRSATFEELQDPSGILDNAYAL